MKILLLFTGAIRGEENLHTIITTLKDQYKDQYKDHQVTVCLATWEPSDKEYKFHGINYYYNYHKSTLTETLGDIVDIFLFQENLDIAKVPKCRNGCPPLFMYQTIAAINTLINEGYNFDIVVKTRNDIIVELSDPIPDKTTLLPLYWSTHNPLGTERLNDHFVITKFDKIKNLTFTTSDILNSWDNEALWTYCIKKMDPDIQIVTPVKYTVRGTRKYV